MTNTSETEPLRIAAIGTPGKGTIGMTLCPGKRQQHSMSGPWERDLEADLDRVAAFGASALVTLMEADELEWVDVPPARMAGSLAARDIEWHHLPIVDVDVPDEEFERLWLLSGPRLRAMLLAGERIVVHCRGGLGRTGTIAGRLLVELGGDPEEAMIEIRAVRPGAIETRAQEDHVRAAVEVEPGLRRQDRITGSILAGAVGDALGAPVEFMTLRAIRERFGPRGIRAYAPSYGRLGAITDDTQMLMFTAEGLIMALSEEGEADPDELTASVWQAYLRWLRTQEEAFEDLRAHEGWLLGIRELWSPRAPGNTCLGALLTGKMGTVAAPLNHSKGCGGVMRVAPVGLLGPRLPSMETAFDLGTATAAITHGHPAGHLSAGFMAALLAGIMEGVSPEESWEGAEALLRLHPDCAAVREALLGARRALDAGPPTVERLERLGGGWTGEEALAISLYAALGHDDLEEALLFAVNHGGDTDSTGAIAGNILGAIQGAGAIPPHLWRPLEMLDVLLGLASRLGQWLR